MLTATRSPVSAVVRNDLAGALDRLTAAHIQVVDLINVIDAWSRRQPLRIAPEAQMAIRKDFRAARRELALAQETVDIALAAQRGICTGR